MWLFDRVPAKQLWKAVELENRIMGAFAVDTSGSQMLEELLDASVDQYQNLQGVGTAEVIATACWYLWWIRRRITHNDRECAATVALDNVYSCSLQCICQGQSKRCFEGDYAMGEAGKR